MKLKLNKQNGYTLVLVLLIITIIFIIATPLINSVLNSSEQFNKTEEQIQLDKTYEMGKTYFRNYVINALNKGEDNVDIQHALEGKEINFLEYPIDRMSFSNIEFKNNGEMVEYIIEIYMDDEIKKQTPLHNPERLIIDKYNIEDGNYGVEKDYS